MARGEQASGDLGRGEFGSRCEAGNGLSRIVLIGWKPCSERNSHLNRVRSIWPVFTGAGLPPARALPISTRSDYADIAQKRISEYTQVKSPIAAGSVASGQVPGAVATTLLDSSTFGFGRARLAKS